MIESIEIPATERINHVHMLIGIDINALRKRVDNLEGCCNPNDEPPQKPSTSSYQPAGSGGYQFTQTDTGLINVKQAPQKHDIKLVSTGKHGLIDMVIADDGDLLAENGLETAVILSLFSDARYHGERGHWADQLIGRVSGSLLWLLKREKTQVQVLRRAEDYAKQSLEWMIKQRKATKIEVSATWLNGGHLSLSLNFY